MMNKRIRHLSAADYMKGNEMVNELKPCPFCGGEASIGKVTYPKDSETAKLNERHIGYFVNCIICGATCGHGLCYATEEKAVAEWNKRVAENKQLKEILAHIITCLSLIRNEKDIIEIPRMVGLLKEYIAEQILKETND